MTSCVIFTWSRGDVVLSVLQALPWSCFQATGLLFVAYMHAGIRASAVTPQPRDKRGFQLPLPLDMAGRDPKRPLSHHWGLLGPLGADIIGSGFEKR